MAIELIHNASVQAHLARALDHHKEFEAVIIITMTPENKFEVSNSTMEIRDIATALVLLQHYVTAETVKNCEQ